MKRQCKQSIGRSCPFAEQRKGASEGWEKKERRFIFWAGPKPNPTHVLLVKDMLTMKKVAQSGWKIDVGDRFSK